MKRVVKRAKINLVDNSVSTLTLLIFDPRFTLENSPSFFLTTFLDKKDFAMNKDQIKTIALAHGFKLKEQADSLMDLNPYVYTFAQALLAAHDRERENTQETTDP